MLVTFFGIIILYSSDLCKIFPHPPDTLDHQVLSVSWGVLHWLSPTSPQTWKLHCSVLISRAERWLSAIGTILCGETGEGLIKGFFSFFVILLEDATRNKRWCSTSYESPASPMWVQTGGPRKIGVEWGCLLTLPGNVPGTRRIQGDVRNSAMEVGRNRSVGKGTCMASPGKCIKEC